MTNYSEEEQLCIILKFNNILFHGSSKQTLQKVLHFFQLSGFLQLPGVAVPPLTLTSYELPSIEFPFLLNLGKVDFSCLE